MKTLIIHPKDPTTFFLSYIYKDIQDKTVLTGGILKSEVRKLIKSHDRIIMLGHGSPVGLFSFWNFQSGNEYIIDKTMVRALSQKQNNIFIWCYADHFIRYHHLFGFASGMFLSERRECLSLGLECITELDIVESNYAFAEIIARHIHENVDNLYENVMNDYGILAETNPAARYNHQRLFLNQPVPVVLDKEV